MSRLSGCPRVGDVLPLRSTLGHQCPTLKVPSSLSYIPPRGVVFLYSEE